MEELIEKKQQHLSKVDKDKRISLEGIPLWHVFSHCREISNGSSVQLIPYGPVEDSKMEAAYFINLSAGQTTLRELGVQSDR